MAIGDGEEMKMTSVDLQNGSFSQVSATQERKQQALSALMDAEGHGESLDLDDDQVKAHWAQYHLIRDAMRDPSSVAPVSDAFVSRMSAAMAREPAHGQLHSTAAVVTGPKPSLWQRMTMAWPGVAVATAVASVMWIAQPLFGLEQGVEQPLVMQEMSNDNAIAYDDPSSAAADYVSAHRHLAGPIAPRQVAFTPGGN